MSRQSDDLAAMQAEDALYDMIESAPFYQSSMPAPCGKRCFESERYARCAHRKAGFRVRVYWCQECRAYHVANQEKR